METKTFSPLLLLSGLMLLGIIATVCTAGEIVGTWEITVDVDGRISYSTLILTQKEDGSLSGTWNDTKLDNIKFEDNKLTCTRTVTGRDDQEFVTDYEARLEGDTLKGTLTNDWFEAPFTGIKPKPLCPALGTWHIGFNVGDRDIKADLCISENKDGSLSGTWTEEGQHSISDVAFKDGTLTFTRQSNVQDVEFTTTYKGTIKGHVLTGMLEGDMGQWQANGKRVGAPLIGTWEFENTAPWGPPTRKLIVYPNMTGHYQWFDGFIPIKDLKLEGDDVTFTIETGFGDRTFVIEFKGKLAEDTLNGEMISDRGPRPANGKRVKKETKETVKQDVKEMKKEQANTKDPQADK